MTTTARAHGRPEPPQAIFERIDRRRTARRAAASVASAAAVPQPPGRAALRIDELLDAGPRPAGGPPAPEEAMADTFPRSATMRMLLRHPEVALGVAVPAAVLLLANPAARRLLQTGLVLGTRPEVRAVVGAALAAAGTAVEERRRRADTAIDGAPATPAASAAPVTTAQPGPREP